MVATLTFATSLSTDPVELDTRTQNDESAASGGVISVALPSPIGWEVSPLVP